MPSRSLAAVLVACCGLPVVWAGCTSSTESSQQEPPAAAAEEAADRAEEDAGLTAEERRRARIDREFPRHGLVTGVQLVVHAEPDAESLKVGWLRAGSRLRLRSRAVHTSKCRTGWYRVYPWGWACAGLGIEIGEERIESAQASSPPPKHAALPYTYYFVKEPLVPEYHRLPSRDEQRAARRFARRYAELLEKSEARAKRMMAGELSNEPPKPAVVRRYLDRGFYVAGVAVEERAFRNFVRTVRGSYVKEAQMVELEAPGFRGVWLGEDRQLPVAWSVRSALPFELRERDDGSLAYIADETEEPIERQTLLPWAGYERVGKRIFHKLEDGRYLKYWFVAVAERRDPPRGTEDDEHWVHVDLAQQTLVLYRGAEPIYATLVSSGIKDFPTPVGTFTIRHKHVSATMSDIGTDDGGERYRVEDVPWTQYFAGSMALHGAFWHGGFGLPRSHGCVNLSPYDAHVVFEHTWPWLPDGWHGVSTEETGLKGSKVVVTE